MKHLNRLTARLPHLNPVSQLVLGRVQPSPIHGWTLAWLGWLRFCLSHPGQEIKLSMNDYLLIVKDTKGLPALQVSSDGLHTSMLLAYINIYIYISTVVPQISEKKYRGYFVVFVLKSLLNPFYISLNHASRNCILWGTGWHRLACYFLCYWESNAKELAGILKIQIMLSRMPWICHTYFICVYIYYIYIII